MDVSKLNGWTRDGPSRIDDLKELLTAHLLTQVRDRKVRGDGFGDGLLLTAKFAKHAKGLGIQ